MSRLPQGQLLSSSLGEGGKESGLAPGWRGTTLLAVLNAPQEGGVEDGRGGSWWVGARELHLT